MQFKDGRPEGSYENFVTGFWVSGEHRRRGVGTTRCSGGNEGRIAADRRRHWWDDLARLLHTIKGSAI